MAKVDSETKKQDNKKVESKKVEKPAVKEKDYKDNHIYHITQRKDDGVWVVKLGGGKVLKLCKTQEEAIAYAKTKAENQDGSIVIHKRDGKIRKLTY